MLDKIHKVGDEYIRTIGLGGGIILNATMEAVEFIIALIHAILYIFPVILGFPLWLIGIISKRSKKNG